MGYFGKSICASDSYEDFTASLLYFLGWRDKDTENYDPDDYKPHTERVGKEAFDGRMEEIISWFNQNHGKNEDALFLAYHILIRGIDISDKRIDLLIKCFEEDEWAKQDEERRIYMNLAIKALIKYKSDKTPVDIDYYYDFERYYIQIGMGKNPLPVNEIKVFFEKEGGIKVIKVLRDNYDLYFLVSKKTYKNFKSDNIMGIKFLTYE